MNIIRRIFGQASDENKQVEAQSNASTHSPMSLNSGSAPSEDEPSNVASEELEETGDSTDINKADTDKLNIANSDLEDTTPDRPDTDRTPIPSSVTRPLSANTVAHQQHVSLSYGLASDVGMVRENNQDACFAIQLSSVTVDERPDFGFFIVADGMGGHHDGEKASALTVETLAAEMLEQIYVPMLKQFDDSDRPTVVEALVAASEKANLEVIKKVPDGGTTLTAVAVVGNFAYLAHVGDSRAYLINNGELEQLTRDHSLVQRLIELNQLTPEEAESHPQKNVLYRAIGQSENLEVERLIRPLPPGAKMLLCSDGLWGLIDDESIRNIVLEAQNPQDACDKLVALANTNGGTDNITVIILQIPSSK